MCLKLPIFLKYCQIFKISGFCGILWIFADFAYRSIIAPYGGSGCTI